MRIGFYGHSRCAWRSETSFLDLIIKELNATLVSTGVRMGSEERALVELKSTKPDVAIVFHCPSKYVYSPNRKIDFCFKTDRGLSTQDEIDMRDSYNKHFRHNDAEQNRVFGAAMQIEQFCKDQNILLINCTDASHPFPKWLKLTDPDNTPMNIVKSHQCEYHEHSNGVTIEGNQLIADHIINKIKNAVGSIVDNAPSFQLGDGGSIPPAAPYDKVEIVDRTSSEKTKTQMARKDSINVKF